MVKQMDYGWKPGGRHLLDFDRNVMPAGTYFITLKTVTEQVTTTILIE
jgi:hypothetical protein